METNTMQKVARCFTFAKSAAVALLCATVALGCLSTPNTRYYTLDMRPSGGAQPGVHLNIARVKVMEPLSRAEILIQTSPTQLEYYAEDAWGASLQELVAEKVRAELGGKQPGQESFDLTLAVMAFQQVDTPDGAEAWAKIGAEVREKGASLYAVPLFEKNYEARILADSTAPNDVVLALGKCLEQIAGQMAQDTRGLKAPEK